MNKIKLALGASLAILAVFIVSGCVGETPTGNATGIFQPNANAAKLDLYVMSQCPYGVQAEAELKELYNFFGRDLNIKIGFILTDLGNGNFQSLHGAAEVAEDKRQACIQAHESQGNLIDYLDCMKSVYDNPEANWESCARSTGINVDTIKTCAAGQEANTLLSQSAAFAKNKVIESSPTLFINDKRYVGSRDARSIERQICKEKPDLAACEQLPPEPAVSMRIITDDNCQACKNEVASMTEQLKGIMSNLTVRNVSFSSTEGQALIQKFGATKLPIYVFDSSIKNHDFYTSYSRYIQENNNDFLLRTSGTEYINRPTMTKQVELFVMSQCPYGVRAETAMKEVIAALPDIKFKVHFIASETDTGFESLHGAPEVSEDLRQVCIQSKYRAKYTQYLECLNRNYSTADSAWQACATAAGISTSTINSCATGSEGNALLSADASLTEELGISASPTFLLNNKITFSSISAEDIKSIICAENAGLAGCEKTLSGDTGSSGGSCGG